MCAQHANRERTAVERVAAFTSKAKPAHLTAGARGLLKRNILDSIGCATSTMAGRFAGAGILAMKSFSHHAARGGPKRSNIVGTANPLHGRRSLPPRPTPGRGFSSLSRTESLTQKVTMA
jgi:hypothetical protein